MQTQINCKGKLLDLTQPIIMGILNTTPDSFYDGGKYSGVEAALFQAEKMLEEGATILDIGGMSSRPGAEIISVEEELNRVIGVIEKISQKFPDTLISIDTIQAKVALEAVGAGASIVNDISAGNLDEEMIPTVAQLKVPYVLMHMQGKPETMQENPVYKQNVVLSIIDFFYNKINECTKAGINDLIIDPGFGFGKTIKDNYEVLKKLEDFKVLDLPILVGISRKSMIWKVLEIKPQEALNGTSVLNTMALLKGANILRVHDVKEAKETIRLYSLII